VSLILVILAMGHAIPTEQLCRQILDLPFQVVGCGFDGAPHCVDQKSPESNQRSAMAEPPTMLAFTVRCDSGYLFPIGKPIYRFRKEISVL